MIDAQQDLDDEILSACHDGELPPAEAEAVRRRLAREPRLAERLHAMHCVDEAAAGAFRALDGEPVPGRVLEVLQAAEAEDRERRLASAKVVSLRPRRAHLRLRIRRRRAALAAGIALAVGFSLGALLRDGSSLAPTALIGRSECEQLPSGGLPAATDYARTVETKFLERAVADSTQAWLARQEPVS